MARRRVVAAMSGGVDSSVAAALLIEQGYSVIGATMRIRHGAAPDTIEANQPRCSSAKAINDARAVAEKLRIPHYVLDMQSQFEDNVIDYFCREYAAGRTPNPCVACNMKLKFGALLEMAMAWGADFVATGHYARVRCGGSSGLCQLLEAVDKHKDQSYALYGLNQHQLAHILFPLGELEKGETRRIAGQLGLTIANKPDSQEICFISDDDYRGFLHERIPGAIQPGPFISTTGQTLGIHKGLPFYTVGQRRRLGIPGPHRLYVVHMDHQRNTITLGEEKELLSFQIGVAQVNWIGQGPLAEPAEASVRVRYRGEPRRALLVPIDDHGVIVRFLQPARAPAPGQAAVFYQGEEVLGGGIIMKRDQLPGTN